LCGIYSILLRTERLIIKPRGIYATTPTEAEKIKMTHINDATSPDQRPSNLKGVVDIVRDGIIHGWAVDLNNLSHQVSLIVMLDDEIIGETRTSDDRPDIVTHVGFPVKAGFRFRFSDIASDRATRVLARLDEHATSGGALQERLVLIYSETGSTVEMKSSYEIPAEEIVNLRHILTQKCEQVDRNFGILEKIKYHTENAAGLGDDPDVRVVAFYLPQYHPIPENDEWWGPGFTEWTNVSSAKPYYKGHHQPRRPGELGFYDLRADEVQERQVKMAKEFGISAFCYYFYWFSGKSLLDMPVKRHVENDLDLDFCLCWANENWSRRWDGSEAEVLLQQQHSAGDDAAFIDQVLPYFESNRYIKIDGAPLLIVYRTTLLSDPKNIFAEWRRKTKAAGYPDLHISIAETFGIKGPNEFGADSAVQFPPHDVRARTMNDQIDDLAPEFTGHIYNYADVVVNEIRRPAPPYLRYNTAMCSWDNTSRKGKAGNVFHGATPELFQTWLSHLVVQARKNVAENKRLVFVNAWNEWAEGSYLEPDSRVGYDYLHAVRNALSIQDIVSGDLLDPNIEMSPELAQKILFTIESLRVSNQALVDSVLDLGIEGRFASPFIRTPLEQLGHLQSNSDAMAWLEMIQQNSTNQGSMTLSTKDKLFAVGWVDIPGLILSETWPIYFGLKNMNRGVSDMFLASVNYRVNREDVKAARKRRPEEEQFNGFSFFGSLAHIDPGRYSLSILVGQDKNSISFTHFDMNWTIDIG
jgi:hypothetical protein